MGRRRRMAQQSSADWNGESSLEILQGTIRRSQKGLYLPSADARTSGGAQQERPVRPVQGQQGKEGPEGGWPKTGRSHYASDAADARQEVQGEEAGIGNLEKGAAHIRAAPFIFTEVIKNEPKHQS